MAVARPQLDSLFAALADPTRRAIIERLLAFTWAWENENGARGHETEVVVNFEAAPGGTRLVLVQRRFESKQTRDNHTNGWSASLDRLAGIAAHGAGDGP